MSKNNSNQRYLKFKEAINETLLRDIILFIVLYVFTLSQDWDNLFLFAFPIISFSFSISFRILSVNKNRMQVSEFDLTYNPIGLEKLHANRLSLVSFLQLILIFWIGAESLYHPQMIKIYNFCFCTLLSIIYSFGFYSLFIDIWKNSKIAVNFSQKDKIKRDTSQQVLSKLKYKAFRNISILNLFLFIVFSLLIIVSQIFIENNLLFRLNVILPGTGIEDSSPLYCSFFLIFVLIIFPVACLLSLAYIYKAVLEFSKVDLITFLNTVPEDIRDLIEENLKALNKRARELFERE